MKHSHVRTQTTQIIFYITIFSCVTLHPGCFRLATFTFFPAQARFFLAYLTWMSQYILDSNLPRRASTFDRALHLKNNPRQFIAHDLTAIFIASATDVNWSVIQKQPQNAAVDRSESSNRHSRALEVEERRAHRLLRLMIFHGLRYCKGSLFCCCCWRVAGIRVPSMSRLNLQRWLSSLLVKAFMKCAWREPAEWRVTWFQNAVACVLPKTTKWILGRELELLKCDHVTWSQV